MAYTTINKSSEHFNTKLYTGNGSTQTISSVGFQPDFTWIKHRDGETAHMLFDYVRGALKRIQTNTANSETTANNTLTSWNSDGFALGTENDTNGSGRLFASWNWKANGAGSANTDGSISSTVSANTTSGFSIVSWSGTASSGTIGHGLGSVPKMIITKSRTNSGDWWGTYHHSLGNNKGIFLNATEESATRTYWNNTTPTSSVFSVSAERSVNGSGENLIAYCFAEKQGYSKFGSYTGNGNDDGAFVYTGFKPAFVIIKSTSTNTWIMLDNKRGSYNVNQSKLFADANSAENTDTSNGIDFLSNGLKLRRNNSEINTSGQSYIFMAFAEAPLVGTNNVPCTAR
ncbi:hypothetical protein N9419_07260 [Candidatus Pelagibacter sp.]|nr:hypothetical protein [Candidatus Pelagibacter sp.]